MLEGMRITAQGVVHTAEPGSARAVACFPSLTVLPGGDLLAVYRAGLSKAASDSVIEIRRSADCGRTWTEPESPFQTVFGGVGGALQVVYVTVLAPDHLLACGLWVDLEAHPGKPLFNEATEGCLPMKILLADSRDRARTWSPWRELPVPAGVGPPSLTSPVARLGDGRLAVSIETNKNYDDASPWLQRVVHCYSYDDGRTWTPPHTVTADPSGRIFHWDQRLGVSPDGVVGAFSWTYDKPANRYLPIRRHLSHDHGATWITDVLPFADQPSHPAVLPSGRIVLAWVDRYQSRSIRARMAASIAAPFDPETEVVLYEAPGCANRTADTGELLADMSTWSFGLPYAEALPDGDAMVVYYAGAPDRMEIRWARLSL